MAQEGIRERELENQEGKYLLNLCEFNILET